MAADQTIDLTTHATDPTGLTAVQRVRLELAIAGLKGYCSNGRTSTSLGAAILKLVPVVMNGDPPAP